MSTFETKLNVKSQNKFNHTEFANPCDIFWVYFKSSRNNESYGELFFKNSHFKRYLHYLKNGFTTYLSIGCFLSELIHLSVV